MEVALQLLVRALAGVDNVGNDNLQVWPRVKYLDIGRQSLQQSGIDWSLAGIVNVVEAVLVIKVGIMLQEKLHDRGVASGPDQEDGAALLVSLDHRESWRNTNASANQDLTIKVTSCSESCRETNV